MNIVIGNVVSLVACVIMVASGYMKSKQKTLIWQTVQLILNTVSCFALQAYSGAIVDLLSVPRNVLAYKDKFTIPAKVVILVPSIILPIVFNVNGLVGYLPVLSTLVYVILMDKLKDRDFKILIIFTLVLWGLHDFFVKNYVSAAFDVGCIVTSSIAIVRIQKDQKKPTLNEEGV